MERSTSSSSPSSSSSVEMSSSSSSSLSSPVDDAPLVLRSLSDYRASDDQRCRRVNSKRASHLISKQLQVLIIIIPDVLIICILKQWAEVNRIENLETLPSSFISALSAIRSSSSASSSSSSSMIASTKASRSGRKRLSISRWTRISRAL